MKVVAATSALGMGFDKPDLAFVVHFQSPGSPIAYYQQVGRAGRQLDTSHGVLLRGAEDATSRTSSSARAFPPQTEAEAVVAHLETVDDYVRIRDLEGGQPAAHPPRDACSSNSRSTAPSRATA